MQRHQTFSRLLLVLTVCSVIICLVRVSSNGANTFAMHFRGTNETSKPCDTEKSRDIGDTGNTGGDAGGVAVCTQQQRLEQIDRMCEHYTGSHATRASMRAAIDSMSDEQIILMTRNWHVVPELETMGCVNWKTGTWTWQSILQRNSKILKMNGKDGGHHPPAQRVHIRLKDYTVPQIRQMFKTYWKFMNIRNPLARLVSAYWDKVRGHSVYAKYLDRKISSFIRGENASDVSATTFKEFLTYVSKNGSDILRPDDDGHWHTLLSRCHPCTLHFDHVVRTETFAEDSRYIVDHRLRGLGNDAKKHVVKDSNPLGRGVWDVVLEEYKDVPGPLLEAVGQRYERDLAFYGYSYTRLPGGAVRAECAALNNNGNKCC